VSAAAATEAPGGVAADGPPPPRPVSGGDRARVRRVLFVLAGVVLGLLAVFPRERASRIALDVRPVPLNPVKPAQAELGSLRYRGGLWLSSTDARFGGLSDLRVSRNGQRLLAISDCGYEFEATLVYGPDGWLSDLSDPELSPLRAPGDLALTHGEGDAEGLARMPDGSLVVSFERRHRLWRYPPGEPPLRGVATALPEAPGFSRLEPNLGIEAMTGLADGRLLAIGEVASPEHEGATAWLGGDRSWSLISYPLFYDRARSAAPLRPTGAALLPSGDVLVLERRYPPLAGRIRLIERAGLEAGNLEGREIARLDEPLSLYNFEGIDARPGTEGGTWVYLLSDDNNCRRDAGPRRRSPQRTLLLAFMLEEND
jgi:hypothetical protein